MSDKYEHEYKVKWHADYCSMKAEEVKAEGVGACDALILHSIIFPPDGSYSHNFFAMDGRERKPLSDEEVFKAWMMLGMTLERKGQLPEDKHFLVSAINGLIREAIFGEPEE